MSEEFNNTEKSVDTNTSNSTSQTSNTYVNRDQGRSSYNNRDESYGRPSPYEDRGDRDNRDRGDRRNSFRRFPKYNKQNSAKLDIDYKKPEILKKFLTERGKILPRSVTGISAKVQRKISIEVKRARHVGFLPFV